MVGLLEKLHRLRVFAAAVFVGQPLAGGPQIIPIEHRGNGIDPDAIDVKFLKPIDKIRHQEVANLIAAVVENQRAPFLVLANTGIGMLVEVGPIKERQAVAILGEMAWHPVQNHPQTLGMATVDKGPEFIGAAIAACGGIPAGHLVSPRAIEGVLGNRHQLDMGEATGLDIGNQAIRQLAIGEQPRPGLEIRRRYRRPRRAVRFDEGGIAGTMHPAA